MATVIQGPKEVSSRKIRKKVTGRIIRTFTWILNVLKMYL